MKKRVFTILVAVVAIIVIVLVYGGNITGNLSKIIYGGFSCEDSDKSVVENGKLTDFSYITKGIVTYSKGKGRSVTKEDYCNTDGMTQVKEFYCDRNEVAETKWVDCETNKCENGACVGCYDSDNEDYPKIMGFAYYSDEETNEVGYDGCISNTQVREYYCDAAGKLTYKDKTCLSYQSCIDGVCRA